MSNDKRIEVGDTVRVFFNRSSTVQGIVDYIPCATGDSWVILAHHSETPVYVQLFDYMILERKSDSGGSDDSDDSDGDNGDDSRNNELENIIESIQEKLSTALQADLEQGVAWMNERESKYFTENYKYLTKALQEIADIDVGE